MRWDGTNKTLPEEPELRLAAGKAAPTHQTATVEGKASVERCGFPTHDEREESTQVETPRSQMGAIVYERSCAQVTLGKAMHEQPMNLFGGTYRYQP